MSVSRVYRLLRLITILQGRRNYTVDELAEELEVSRRTIFRDLNMLELAHIPYYYDSDTGGYTISRHFFLPPINLTLTEALAVMMLAGTARGTGQLPLMAHSARAAMKLESALPAGIRSHVGSVIDRLTMSLGPTSRHEGLDDLFDDLAAAVAGRRLCRLIYISFYEHKQTAVTARPLRLVFVGRAWYLIAYSEEHREIRTFKLGRIRKLTVTDRNFTHPQDIKLEDYFGQAWSMIPEGKTYEVHVRFDSAVAGNVAEVLWHKTQRVEWNDDGSMEFHATVDGIGEIAWWLLSYGDQAEVIAPDELRERIADTADAMVRKYRREGA